MIIHVPFAYRAEVIPKRARLSVQRIYLSVVPVEIRELGVEAVPLAFRMPDPETARGTRIIELRSFDDKFWRPVFTSKDVECGAPMTLHGMATAAMSGQSTKLFESRYSMERMTQIDDPNAIISKIENSERDKTAADIVGKTSNLIAIDGVMHEPCPEPVYVLCGTYEKSVTIGWYPEISGADKATDSIYGAEEFSLIEKRDDLFAGDHWRPKHLIEILDPAAPSRRLSRNAARQVAEEVKELCVSRLANGDRAFFDLFATIRDELMEDVVDSNQFIDLARKGVESLTLGSFWVDRINNAAERVQYADADLALANLGERASPRR